MRPAVAGLVGHGALAGRVGRAAQPGVLMLARVRRLRNGGVVVPVVVEVSG